MITTPTSIEELKQIFAEELFNKTDKITKISPGSVLNGVSYGVAKIGQRTLKEIARVEAHLLPESAYGKYLDNLVADAGIAPRYGALGSSTYMRLVGAAGSTYAAATVRFTGKEGILFSLEVDCTLPQGGYAYAKVFSSTTGLASNVAALSLNKIQNSPPGHQYCINEYTAVGGIDSETDEGLRYRLQNKINLLGKGTEEMLTQAFIRINPRVLRVSFVGIGRSGKNQVLVLAQNGVDFSKSEFDEFLAQGRRLFNLSDIKPYGRRGDVFVELVNALWQPIDVNLRVQLDAQYTPDAVRKEIQIRMSKYLDYRYYKKDRVDWTDLLQIAKSTPGVLNAPDTSFLPNYDVPIIPGRLPRLRGFRLLDLKGSLIADGDNNLNPFYYPAVADSDYQATILTSF